MGKLTLLFVAQNPKVATFPRMRIRFYTEHSSQIWEFRFSFLELQFPKLQLSHIWEALSFMGNSHLWVRASQFWESTFPYMRIWNCTEHISHKWEFSVLGVKLPQSRTRFPYLRIRFDGEHNDKNITWQKSFYVSLVKSYMIKISRDKKHFMSPRELNYDKNIMKIIVRYFWICSIYKGVKWETRFQK